MIVAGVDESKLVTYATEMWRRLKGERLTKEQIWYECWLAYNKKFGRTWAEIAEYRSRRYLPLSFQAVEAVGSQIASGVMPHGDWFSIQGRTPDDDDRAKLMTALLKYQHEKSGFRSKFAQDFVKSALVFGNVPWCVTWKTDWVNIPDVAALGENLANIHMMMEQGSEELPKPSTPQKAVKKYDGPDFKVGNIFDYVQERYYNDVAYAPRIIRSHKTKAYLQQYSVADENGDSLYSNVDKLTDGFSENEPSDFLKRSFEQQMGLIPAVNHMVELLECWGDFEIPSGIGGEKTVYKNHVLVIGNRSTVLRFEPNPFMHGKCPWQMFTLFPIPNEIYGNGLLEPVLDLQDVANVRMNQVIEANALTVNPQFAVVQDGIIDTENFISAPGAIHAVAQQGNIQPLAVPNTSNIGMAEIGFVMSQFNDITGAMKAFSSENYQKSATEIAATSGMANARAAEMIRSFEQNCILPVLDMEVQLNQQLMEDATFIRITEPTNAPTAMDPNSGMPMMPEGPMTVRISPEDILGDFDSIATGATWVANNQQQIQLMIQATQAIAQSPAQSVIKWDEYARTLYQRMDVRDAWKFIKTPQEVQFEQQQAQQQQLAMAAAQQSMGGNGQGAGPANAGASPMPTGMGGIQDMVGVPSGGMPPTGGPAPAQLAGPRIG